ncbi:hypothetical protein Q5425_00160 [Amycolatopsis sp. A133]|uniref:hypothetical protein n=1 Tax=Amycolatopsis sp. A133 TaxID=3064472 RepID=UPI0027EBDBFF|nr:hypothetical protein [Amycolatopsis sp. A133]MDQ7802124.1 hypothetical protein [Amycolatopsis sp. A133]
MGCRGWLGSRVLGRAGLVGLAGLVWRPGGYARQFGDGVRQRRCVLGPARFGGEGL